MLVARTWHPHAFNTTMHFTQCCRQRSCKLHVRPRLPSLTRIAVSRIRDAEYKRTRFPARLGKGCRGSACDTTCAKIPSCRDRILRARATDHCAPSDSPWHGTPYTRLLKRSTDPCTYGIAVPFGIRSLLSTHSIFWLVAIAFIPATPVCIPSTLQYPYRTENSPKRSAQLNVWRYPCLIFLNASLGAGV